MNVCEQISSDITWPESTGDEKQHSGQIVAKLPRDETQLNLSHHWYSLSIVGWAIHTFRDEIVNTSVSAL